MTAVVFQMTPGGCRLGRIDADTARAAIGAITAADDVSRRRARLEAPLGLFTLGQSLVTLTPLGPCL
jgi:2-keto-4-pentenoate hydratase/2-oxohepta-3-ene-1,7-dioic acid hydratase in catechol pathway